MVPEDVISVLEPSPGLGNLVSKLSRYRVTAATDFFLLDQLERWDCIVMNPPFSSKSGHMEHAPAGAEHRGMKLGYYFLTECMKKSDNIIALMPWFTISDSDRRLRMIKRFGLKSITALPRKTFEYARIQTCILNMQKGYQGPCEFIVYDTLDDDSKPKLAI
jgi:type I restriction-modification system DNA methylase subunit